MRIAEALPYLPATITRHAEDTRLGVLPLPVPDTPEARTACDAWATAHVIALRPGDAFELMLAVRIVCAHAHAMECLRLSDQPGLEIDLVLRCRSQALAMMRAARDGRRMLLDVQASRAKPLALARANPPAVATGRRSQSSATSLRLLETVPGPKRPLLH